MGCDCNHLKTVLMIALEHLDTVTVHELLQEMFNPYPANVENMVSS